MNLLIGMGLCSAQWATVAARKTAWLIRWVASAPLLVAGIVILSVHNPHRGGLTWIQLGSSNSTFALPFPTNYSLAGAIISGVLTTLFFCRSSLRDEVRRTLADSTRLTPTLLS